MNLRKLALASTLAVGVLLTALAPVANAQPKPAASVPQADLLQPAELAAQLQSAAGSAPLLLHVGFKALYTQAHIPNSDYVGPTSEDEGLALLRARVANVAKDAPIVIYCGCCPWSRCPNVAAAYDALHAAGYTHVKVLYIAQNFGTDWADHGYPVAKGS